MRQKIPRVREGAMIISDPFRYFPLASALFACVGMKVGR